MIFGSVCSGIEAASVAWKPLGWRCAFVSEIDKFPRAVLSHHYPDTPLHGDFTTIEAGQYEPIDLLVGGTPCQDFSVAGLRAGITGDRGNLTLQFSRLARRLGSKWMVWENVPGAFSLNKGRDFGAVLACFAGYPDGYIFEPPAGGWRNSGIVSPAGPGGYGLAWVVRDAQFFGLAQRRERVFVVGYLGDWRPAAAVLFERESLSGNPAPRREKGEGVAGTITAGLGERGADDPERGTLIARCVTTGEGARQDYETTTLVTHTLRGEGFDASEDGTGRGVPLVPIPIDMRQASRGDKMTNNRAEGCSGGAPGTGIGKPGDPMPTIAASHVPAIAFDSKASGRNGFAVGEISPTLRAMGNKDSHANAGGQLAVAFAQNQRDEVREMDLAGALAAEPGMKQQTYLHQAAKVRRLTPRECERLQGFPGIQRQVTMRICASEEERRVLASSAGQISAAQKPGPSGHADVHVLIDLERQHLQIHSLGRLIWSASTAAKPSASPLSMPVVDFVRLAAHMTTIAAPRIRDGGAALQPSMTASLPLWSGSAFVPLYGGEIVALADDVERFTMEVDRCMRSITSEAGQNSLNSEPTQPISCYCVASAIASCIREPISGGSSFDLRVETRSGYTNIPYRGKPAADGPRYKALGNSMAVPVMAWIGKRIDLVTKLMTEPASEREVA